MTPAFKLINFCFSVSGEHLGFGGGHLGFGTGSAALVLQVTQHPRFCKLFLVTQIPNMNTIVNVAGTTRTAALRIPELNRLPRIQV